MHTNASEFWVENINAIFLREVVQVLQNHLIFGQLWLQDIHPQQVDDSVAHLCNQSKDHVMSVSNIANAQMVARIAHVKTILWATSFVDGKCIY